MMTEKENLSVHDICKAFDRTPLLDGINLAAGQAQLLVVCGLPSTGKTTLARIICGLEKPDSGSVKILGRDVTNIKSSDRNIGYVPQSFALFPNMSVHKNIAYPLLQAKVGKNEIATKVQRMAEMLSIDSILDKRVDQISGGQKQRVAIARGLVKECALYVLDDPLVGLDFKLREQLILDLRLLQKHMETTFLYLTGDPLEPLMIGDNVAVLDAGRIKENAPVIDAYRAPQSAAMVRVLGLPRANFIDALITRNGRASEVSCELFKLKLSDTKLSTDSTGHLKLSIRPEHIGFGDAPGDAITFHGDVQLVEDIGVDSIIHVQTAKSGRLVACQPSAALRSRDSLHGTQVRMWVRPTMIRAYDAASGHLIEGTLATDNS